jgi:predicted PurR-regulated permease PerM
MRASVDRWMRARDIGLTILIWILVILVFFWLVGHFVNAILLFVVAALLAYALVPGVTLLQRWMPRLLAVAIVYVLALAVIGGLGYLIVSTAVSQLASLVEELPTFLKPSTPGHPSPLFRLLQPLGVTQAQIDDARQQALTWLESSAGQIVNSALPIITGVASGIINTILVFILSIYLVLDGPRVYRWLSTAPPRPIRTRSAFFLNTLRRTVGGYIRGQLFMSTFIGVLVGGGMAAFQVPYALLLGILAFILEFIPIVGTIISGAACVLIALATKGPLIAGLVLGYFLVVHILEGDVIGPRVIGKVLGLHPIVAILALVAGSELFGIWGAIFAAPIVGLLQAVAVSAWVEWQEVHPDQIPPPPPDVVAEVKSKLEGSDPVFVSEASVEPKPEAKAEEPEAETHTPTPTPSG